jgi:hypothetical protein
MHIDVSGHNFVFPRKCACCDATADTELPTSATRSTGKRVVHTRTNVWDFPYCHRCVRHVTSIEAAKSLGRMLAILSLCLGLLLAFILGAASGLIIGLLGIVATGIIRRRGINGARALCGTDCVCVGRAMAYLGWHGTLHHIDIVSTRYAGEFILANRTKLVNLSAQAQNLLTGAGYRSKMTARTPRRYQT